MGLHQGEKSGVCLSVSVFVQTKGMASIHWVFHPLLGARKRNEDMAKRGGLLLKYIDPDGRGRK
jgi:hypothetical protein